MQIFTVVCLDSSKAQLTELVFTCSVMFCKTRCVCVWGGGDHTSLNRFHEMLLQHKGGKLINS